MTLRYVVETFGCQMNAHDSERMEDLLRSNGWTRADRAEDAELVVFNTCSVREKAEQKLRSEVGKLAPLKARRPDLVIAVAGCVAQQEGERLLARVKHLDLVVGPDNLAELPDLVLAQMHGAPPTARTVFDVDVPSFLPAFPAPQAPGARRAAAYVTTMKGCDERCSFCIVPYTRGPERYRPADAIVEEITRWVQSGVREILLLGQTVDSYRDPGLPPPADGPEAADESQFPALLRAIARSVPLYDPDRPNEPGLARLRYTSPHPRHATASLAAAHAELDVLAHHVHLPVQSGSDRILKRMIRRHTRAEYVARARRLLASRPDMTMSTDIIVGFPGETEEDFEATLSLVREVGFVQVFGFKYSPRPYTPALKLADDVPEEVKAKRLTRLFEVVEEQGAAHLSSLVGSTQEVLLEGPSKANPGQGEKMQGRTVRNEIVHVDVPAGSDPVGLLVEVSIVRANRHSLEGQLTKRGAARVRERAIAGPVSPAASSPPRRRTLPVFPS